MANLIKISILFYGEEGKRMAVEEPVNGAARDSFENKPFPN